MRTLLRRSLCLLVLLAVVVPTPAASRYWITDLGTPPGYQASYATCLNDRGQVAGNLIRSGRSGGGRATGTVAFLWAHGGIHSLPSLKSPFGSGHDIYDAIASGINNQDEVVGTLSYPIEGTWIGTDLQAVVWFHRHLRKIPRLMDQNTAIAINDAGQIAGTAANDFQSGETDPHIYLYAKGKNSDLGPGCATGLNAQGDVSGYVLLDAHGRPTTQALAGLIGSTAAVMQVHAVLCRPGRPRLSLGSGYALTVNKNNDVVTTTEGVVGVPVPLLLRSELVSALVQGEVRQTTSSVHGHTGIVVFSHVKVPAAPAARLLLWRTGQGRSRPILLPIHWLPQANNDKGQIDGGHWLWQQGHEYDLNHLIGRAGDWRIVMTAAINRHGQIVGWGYRHGKPRAFLLTPRGMRLGG